MGYVRVSSFEQNESRQLEGLQLDRVFLDKASGKNIQRPQLEALMKYVRDGDTVICHSMDRLGRNLVDLRRTVTELTSRKIGIRFIKENLTLTGDDLADGNTAFKHDGFVRGVRTGVEPGTPARGNRVGEAGGYL